MDCGRPRQVSELWAALVRTTGLSNLPPWRACERTGQHLGRGEDKPRAGASRASTTVLARRFRADPHEVGRIEGLGLDSLELAEHVDQGQQIEVSAGHEPEDVAPVSSSTRASVARDARRSHRSVEGDKLLCVERAETPILYKRD